MTIEDPEMFVEPWVMPTRVLRATRGPEVGIQPERANCEVYEEGNVYESASTLRARRYNQALDLSPGARHAATLGPPVVGFFSVAM